MKKRLLSCLMAFVMMFSVILAVAQPAETAYAKDIMDLTKEELKAYEAEFKDWYENDWLKRPYAELISCGPTFQTWLFGKLGKEAKEKEDLAVDDVAYINWTTRNFYTGSVDASSMGQPFNAWYDIVYMELFGEEDPQGMDGWQKSGTEKYSEALNAFENGEMTLGEFNDAMEKLAVEIQKLVNESEGSTVTINYILNAKTSGFTEDDKLFTDSTSEGLAPAYISPSGKTAVYAGVTTLEAKTTENVSLKKSGKNKLTVSWTDVTSYYVNGEKKTSAEDVSAVDGYQIRYSTNKKFKSGVKKVKVAAGKNQRVLKKLTKGKTYYVQMRSYKKVDGKTVWGAWSTKKKIKL